MKPRGASLAAALLAFAAVATYWLLNYTQIDQGVKWLLFAIHLAISSLGFLTALWAMKTQRWIGGSCVIICGYFVYLQLLS